MTNNNTNINENTFIIRVDVCNSNSKTSLDPGRCGSMVENCPVYPKVAS